MTDTGIVLSSSVFTLCAILRAVANFQPEADFSDESEFCILSADAVLIMCTRKRTVKVSQDLTISHTYEIIYGSWLLGWWQQPVSSQLYFQPSAVTWIGGTAPPVCSQTWKEFGPPSLSPKGQVEVCHQCGRKSPLDSRCMTLYL